jgi:hypothetical protein
VDWKNSGLRKLFNRSLEGHMKLSLRVVVDIETVGQTDSIFFRREEATAEIPLAADHIEVSVKAVGLSTRVSYDDGQRMRAVANRVNSLCRTFKPSAAMLRTAAARPARLSTVLWSRELAMV